MIENALYVVSNINEETVKDVAAAIKKAIKCEFSKIFIITTSKNHEKINEQIDLYRSYFGNNIRFEEVIIDINNDNDQIKLASIFKETKNQYIDLTNGIKPLAVLLYMSACLSNIDNIYYLNRKSNTTSEYVKMQRFIHTEAFSDFTFFDMIYYKEEINNIFKETNAFTSGSLMWKVKTEMSESLFSFFLKNNYKNAILSAVSGVEGVIRVFFQYLKDSEEAKEFNQENGNKIDFKKGPDPIETLIKFYKAYLNNSYNGSLLALHSVPWLLASLREYRNAAAHYVKHSHVFSSDEARLVINSSIQLYKTLKQDNNLWQKLLEENLIEKDRESDLNKDEIYD